MTAPTTAPVLTVAGLRVRFGHGPGAVHAVNGVDFTLAPAEVLGIVGESGSGKSAALRAIIGLLPVTATVSGSVRYGEQELVGATDKVLRGVRGAQISLVSQDPMTALNPVLTVGEQIGEALQRHTDLGRAARRRRVLELLELVGIAAGERRIRQHPHELSGGMRQRVAIAIALACEPKVLLADEPTTALDVSVQSQVLALLDELRQRLGTSIVLVSHDLGVIGSTCDRVAVMYAGEVVEAAEVRPLVRRPRHPYTRGLLRSLPGELASGRFLEAIPGAPVSLTEDPTLCSFAPRCGLHDGGCDAWPTELLQAGAAHVARCRRHTEVEAVNHG